ncbi:MAG: hypothetical protein ACUVSF_09230 [Anaerolineae bacterium]
MSGRGMNRLREVGWNDTRNLFTRCVGLQVGREWVLVILADGQPGLSETLDPDGLELGASRSQA